MFSAHEGLERRPPHTSLTLVSFARLKANAGVQTDRSAR
jgi:hypothetical protein